MELKKIQIGDQMVDVDAARYAAFESTLRNPAFLQNLTGRDANEALSFVVSQLAYTESQVFEKLYLPMQYEELLPISHEAGEWADSIRFETYDAAGQGKKSSGSGRDINLVNVQYGEVNWGVSLGNIGYEYNTEELRRTAYLRRPIPERKMAAAVEGYQRHMNAVGLYGEVESNFTGLFNNPFVPRANAPNGAWMTTNAANPDKIRQDINSIIRLIWKNTQYNDMPDTIAIAPDQFGFISETPLSPTYPAGGTILEWVRKNNVAKSERNIDINFTPAYGLDTAGNTGNARMMAYVKNPNRLVFHIPMALRFLAPQLLGLAVQVPGEYKYSGVEFRYVKSAAYYDGI
jgi:hypothetical protein